MQANGLKPLFWLEFIALYSLAFCGICGVRLLIFTRRDGLPEGQGSELGKGRETEMEELNCATKCISGQHEGPCEGQREDAYQA